MSSPPVVAMKEAGGIDRDKIRQELFLSLQLSETERLRICNLEQGTEEWLNARKNRLTGSNFGAAVGHNKWKSPAALAHDMLYGTFKGNDATRWGNDHEDLACQEYCLARRSQLERENAESEVKFAVTHSGLNPHPTMNWLAVSPDGHVKENGVDGLLEIKCPYSQRIYPEIPPYYMDQIQGGMGVLELPWADFCVWTPHSMQIQRVHFDRRYWEDRLKPGQPRPLPLRRLPSSCLLCSLVPHLPVLCRCACKLHDVLVRLLCDPARSALTAACAPRARALLPLGLRARIRRSRGAPAPGRQLGASCAPLASFALFASGRVDRAGDSGQGQTGTRGSKQLRAAKHKLWPVVVWTLLGWDVQDATRNTQVERLPRQSRCA